jgi:NADH dehydrogenase [ubiquinone] 1 alpha subcomplex assembly factor 2
VPPSWHQWLRHTRAAPPTVDEQKSDRLRQERIKVLAAQADARWASRPSVLDGPELGQTVPPLRSARRDGATRPAGTLAEDVRETMSSGDRPDEEPGSSEKESWGVSQEGDKEAVRAGRAPAVKDSWKPARGPSEDWQPKGWNPGAASKR